MGREGETGISLVAAAVGRGVGKRGGRESGGRGVERMEERRLKPMLCLSKFQRGTSLVPSRVPTWRVEATGLAFGFGFRVF